MNTAPPDMTEKIKELIAKSKAKTKWVGIDTIRENPRNPSKISAKDFEKLKKSITDFPEMLIYRPGIIDGDGNLIAGNKRHRACKALGWTKFPVIDASALSPEQLKEFIIKDNLVAGEFDWDVLQEDNWDFETLEGWGLEIPEFEEEPPAPENIYTKKIVAPTYEPSAEKPELSSLVDRVKTDQLWAEIEKANISDADKAFLRIAAARHFVFNYSRIADYYAHAPKEIQELMEKSALVIIDFDKAIENGYVNLSQELADQYSKDYDEA